MFASRSKAERTAAQAWDYLSSAMATAREGARDAGEQTADTTARFTRKVGRRSIKLGDRATRKSAELTDRATRKSTALASRASRKSAALASQVGRTSTALAGLASEKADEAWTRANAAADALAGRKPRTPWRLIIGAALLGTALGWAAAGLARAVEQLQAAKEELEAAENVVVVTPAYEE
jgi:hypothetical protein